MVLIGKMGQQVANAMDKIEDLLLIGGLDRENTGFYTYPVYTSSEKIEEKPDIIIDFSIPSATLQMLSYAKKEHIPVVIATTGFTKEQLDMIQQISKEIPIFQSSNMSYEINLFSKLVAKLAKELNNFDIEIIETHHNRKVDSPSGTAILLADSINSALGGEMTYEYNRHQKQEKRNKKEIGISSIRGGNIVGEHTVQFLGENETFEITHRCYSRTVFAQGAIKAARFLLDKPAGYYTMNDLIEN